jgi:hypothetical protein
VFFKAYLHSALKGRKNRKGFLPGFNVEDMVVAGSAQAVPESYYYCRLCLLIKEPMKHGGLLA